MTVITPILEVVLPVFLLAAAGYVWVRRNIEFDIEFVGRLALEFCVPCLVFGKLASVSFNGAIFAAIAMATVTFYAVSALVMAGVVAFLRMGQRDFLLPLVSANTGNIGLPLCFFAFGEQGLVYAIVLFATMVVLQFTFGLWLVSGEPSPLKAVRHPLVLASVFGALFSWQGIEIPKALSNAIDLAGQPAIPLMLLALGAAIAGLPAFMTWRVAGIAAFKLLLSGVLAIAIGRAFNLDPLVQSVFIVQAITPVAVTSWMLAQRYNRRHEEVAQMVLASTVLVALAMPVVLYFLL